MKQKILIEFERSVNNTEISKKAAKKWIKGVLKELNLKDKGLSLLFSTSDSIRKLNMEYRGIDKATDVLSFSQLEGDFVINEDFLGDIVVSIDKAKEQSEDNRITLEEEVFFLVLHGILHLIGYDHDEENTGDMGIIENSIYKKLLGVTIE